MAPQTDPNRATLTVVQSDLMAISNRAARIKAAIKVLEDEGYIEPSALVETANAARVVDEAGDVMRPLVVVVASSRSRKAERPPQRWCYRNRRVADAKRPAPCDDGHGQSHRCVGARHGRCHPDPKPRTGNRRGCRLRGRRRFSGEPSSTRPMPCCASPRDCDDIASSSVLQFLDEALEPARAPPKES